MSRLLDLDTWQYLINGLLHGASLNPKCPSCDSGNATLVDAKHFNRLFECCTCHLLFRHPPDSGEKMFRFYQRNYVQEGLTTSLPDDEALREMMATNFKKTSKNIDQDLHLLEQLGVSKGASVFDYGANWGYAVYQFQQAGYQAIGFDVSVPRAAFAEKLGVTVQDKLERISGTYDIVYSAHVLEHTPNPAASLREQWARVKPGGLLIGRTPNGSAAYRHTSGFKKSWGLVHPVLLTDQFLSYIFPDEELSLGTSSDPIEIKNASTGSGCDFWELIFVVKKKNS